MSAYESHVYLIRTKFQPIKVPPIKKKYSQEKQKICKGDSFICTRSDTISLHACHSNPSNGNGDFAIKII